MVAYFLCVLLQCMLISQTFAQGSSPFVASLYVNEPEWINDANGSVPSGGMRYYRFTREPNYHYSICVGGIVGDVDLYGWRVGLPTLQDFGKRSVYSGNQEECIQFNAKVAGDYYLMVYGKASWSDYAIYVVGDKINDYPSYMERKLSCPFETTTTSSAYCRRLTNKTTAHMAAPWGWVNPSNPVQTEDTPFYVDPDKDHANKFHNGIDLYAPVGTPVYAVYPGVLRKIGFLGDGKCDYIAIEHNINGNLFTTAYAHVDPSWWLWADYKVGNDQISVSQNQYLGRTCDIDLSDEEPDHLHFAIRTGEFVDTDPDPNKEDKKKVPTAWSGAMGYYHWLQYGGNFVNPNPRTNPKLYIKRSRSVASVQSLEYNAAQLPDPDGLPEEGDLIRGSTPEIYLYTEGIKRYITSPEILDACRFTGLPIVGAADSFMSSIPTDERIDSYDDCLADGDLIKTSNDPAIYLYQQGKKRYVTSPEIFTACRFDNSAVRTLSGVVVNPIPSGDWVDRYDDCLVNGDLFKVAADPAIYVYENGYKRYVTSPEIFEACGFTNAAVRTLSDVIVNSIPVGVQVDSYDDCLVDGDLIKTPTDPAIYLYEQGYKRWITSPEAFDACQFESEDVWTLSEGVVNPIPAGRSIATASDCLPEGILLRGPSDPAIYYYSQGMRHWITSPEVFNGCLFNLDEIQDISDELLAPIPLSTPIDSLASCPP